MPAMYCIKRLIYVRSVSALDNTKSSWWSSHRPSSRRMIQLYAALLFNAHLKGFIKGDIYTGKTKYAIEFASKINAEIVSCDSLLVYKGMDIGTAKPTGGELEKVRHHALNLVTPDHNFDVAKYIEYARESINDILRCGKNVIMVGGSGLYLRGFYYPVVDDVSVDEEINTLVDDMYERYNA